MKIVILSVLACTFFLRVGLGDDFGNEYTQTYIIFIDDSRAGKETVTEKVSGNGDRIAQSENEIYITDGMETNRMAFSTRMVLDGKSLTPKSYMFRYDSGNSGDHYEVQVEGDSITRTLNRAGETSFATAEFKSDSVILEINVYHQYDYVLKKYNEKKGGRQLFSDFIPVIGSNIPIALTFIGKSSLNYSKGELPVKKYQIEFVGLRSGVVTADENGRLVRVVIPDQDLEVVREDLIPANR